VYKEYVGDFTLNPSELPFPGHARRGGDGVDMYGKKYLKEEHKEVLVDLVEKGNINASKKLQPAQMLERIKDMFPDSFLLPSEYEVRSYIQQYLSSSKTRANSNRQGTGTTAVFRMKPEHLKWMSDYLKAGNIKKYPRHVIRDLEHHFPDDTEFIEANQKKITAKVSYVTASLKKKAERDIL
jgi:hypothetical protein